MKNVGTEKNDDGVEVDAMDLWPESVEKTVIQLMVDEVDEENRTATTFSRKVWNDIQKEVADRFVKDYTLEQLKEKYNELRERHSTFKALISERGAHYITATGAIEAIDDCWERWSKIHKMCERFRRRGCPEFGKLCIIFGDTTAASGMNAYASTHASATAPESGEEEVDTQADRRKKKCNSKSKSKGVKRKKEKIPHDLLGKLISLMQAQVDNDLLELYQEEESRQQKRAGTSKIGGGPANEASSVDKDSKILIECSKIMDEMGVNGKEFAKGLTAIHDSPSYGNVFLIMSEKRRKEWLQSL